ncbi:MAG: hydroxysqualene dehydroxylase [Planctomycetaceae bacterium]
MPRRVVIVGGGLAGLAAATALAPRGFAVTLLESRPRLGGRASSFVDAATDEPIDNCQHVAFGCCTNFLHFCHTIGRDHCFLRDDRLTFVEPDGKCSYLAPAPLPAPLHLFPSFLRLTFLTAGEKWSVARGLLALARSRTTDARESFLDWLGRHRQPAAAISRFWGPVIISALSDTLDRTDVGHARKVFVDLLLRNRAGWDMITPTVPLDELYGESLADWFQKHGVAARLLAGVRAVRRADVTDGSQFLVERPAAESVSAGQASDTGQIAGVGVATRAHEAISAEVGVACGVELRSGEFVPGEHVILAAPHSLALGLLPDEWRGLPELSGIAKLETAPISSVHLWFDRPLTDLRQATFVERLSQWVFNRSGQSAGRSQASGVSTPVVSPPRSRGASQAERTYYYQIVISASHGVAGRPQEETIRTVVAELCEVWPATRDARLVHSRLVTEHKAVVSMVPGVDALRPAQQTSVPNLYLAGDWTQTGWPCTMEGAVRSGYLAAECVLRNCGEPESLVQPDLPTAPLSRLLLGL